MGQTRLPMAAESLSFDAKPPHPLPPPMSTLVRAAALTNYVAVARERGLNPALLMREAGLSLAMLEQPEQHIPADAVIGLLEKSAQLADCDNFALRMAAGRQLSDFGAVSLLLSHQRNLRDALNTTVQYRHLLNENLAMQLEDTGTLTIVREEVVSALPARQATELAVAVLFRMGASLLGPRWRPHSVNFAHAAPRDTALHRQLFACRLEFNSEFNGFVCPQADLDLPNPLADPAMARYARQLLDLQPRAHTQSIVLEVRKAIYLMLPIGRASSDCVAQGLGLSVRTMQRQLDEAGQSFTTLLNQVRCELAQRYIENPQHSMVRISELLGYSTPSSFTRWFIAQFGMPPMAHRAHSRRQAAPA